MLSTELDLLAKNRFLAEAMLWIFSVQTGFKSQSVFFSTKVWIMIYGSHALVLSLLQLVSDVSLLALSASPLSPACWESIWFQRLKKSKLSSTLFFWKGWWLEPKDRLGFFNASTNDCFHLQQTLLSSFKDCVILIPFPYGSQQLHKFSGDSKLSPMLWAWKKVGLVN